MKHILIRGTLYVKILAEADAVQDVYDQAIEAKEANGGELPVSHDLWGIDSLEDAANHLGREAIREGLYDVKDWELTPEL